MIEAKQASRMVPRPEHGVVAATALLVVLIVVVGRVSTPVFLILAAGTLALAAVCAHLWPRATLVGATLMTLADPVITPQLLPGALALGPIGASEPLLAVAGVVIAYDAWRRGTFVPALRDPVFWLALVWVLVAAVSALVNSTPPLVATLGIVMTVDAIAIYFVWRMVPSTSSQAFSAVSVIVLAVSVAALVGIGQLWFDSSLEGYRRITSFLGNPNMLALVIGLALPFPLYGSRHLERRRLRWAAGILAFTLLLALVLTFSRGAWISVVLGMLLGTLILDRRTFLPLLLASVLAFGAAVALPRSAPADDGAAKPPPDVISTVLSRFGQLTGGDDTRLRWVADGLRIIEDHPWFGVGPGRYGGAAATIIPSPVYAEYGTSLGGHRTVHNFWLHLMGEVGVFGFAVFLTMLVGLTIRCIRAAKRATGTVFVLLAGTATMMLVVGINDLTEMLFEGNVPGLLVWLILGIASTLAPTSPPEGVQAATDGPAA